MSLCCGGREIEEGVRGTSKTRSMVVRIATKEMLRHMGRGLYVWSILVLTVGVLMFAGTAWGGTASEEQANGRETRIEELEDTVRQLIDEIQILKEDVKDEKELREKHQEEQLELIDQVEQINESPVLDAASWLNKFTFGGYGEMHANFGEGSTADQFDIHRFVLYLGYDFNDWIKFHSETEIEHAYVSSDSGGEVSIEQAYVDFLISDAFNIRAGRVLTPVGIVNKKHEPPTFNGVERPSFAKYIVPTTWSSDGIGLFGSLTPSLRYEAYVVGGLDGSKFDATNGIRKGRIKERPGLHDPAFTGRLDYYPFAERAVAYGQTLRVGVSTYAGGIDNGNSGKNPDISGDIQVYSADFEYTISKLDLRGAVAHETIDGARAIGGGAASEIFGWYFEAGCHVWPAGWKTGKLADSDAVFFVRYDDFDTQYRMPAGVADDPAGDRDEWTVGVNFYLAPNFVVKADYQIRDDASSGDLDDLVNFGVGWQF